MENVVINLEKQKNVRENQINFSPPQGTRSFSLFPQKNRRRDGIPAAVLLREEKS